MSAEAKEIHKQKWNLMLEIKHTVHGLPQRGASGPCTPLIFIHGTEYL